MPCQQLGLARGYFWKLTFKHLGDFSVQGSPGLAQQRPVSCVLYQSVFEQIGGVRRRALTE